MICFQCKLWWVAKEHALSDNRLGLFNAMQGTPLPKSQCCDPQLLGDLDVPRVAEDPSLHEADQHSSIHPLHQPQTADMHGAICDHVRREASDGHQGAHISTQ